MNDRLEVTVHDGLVTGLAPAKDLFEETLYDAHAARLHAYCWSLVGDDAPEALKDTFVAVSRLGAPRGDAVPWLYALARAACYRRGAFDHAFDSRRDSDPLMRAAAHLRAEQREVLVLSAGEWLETPQFARLLGVAPDTVRQMIQVAASQLERAVLDTLIREPMSTRHDDVIAAFEKGRLPALLAGRAPTRPPALLRAEVLAGVCRPVAEPLAASGKDTEAAVAGRASSEDRKAGGSRAGSTAAASGPLIVIDAGQRTRTTGPAGRRKKRAVEAAGLAAALAAAAGVLVAFPSADGQSTGDLAALVPGNGGSGHAIATRSGAPTGTSTAPEISGSVPFGHVTGMSPTPPPASPNGVGLPFWPGPGRGSLPIPAPGVSLPHPVPPATGGHPTPPSTPRPSTPPSTPPSDPPSTPPPSPSTPPPSTPPPSSTPAPVPSEPADPAPAPTKHPEPGPSESASESTGGSAAP
ncbi:MAG TPA: RNA polymerase sigma factor [Actinomadura sp.]|nr:RNA polymerase sigma factor [Actinomadura sp.]